MTISHHIHINPKAKLPRTKRVQAKISEIFTDGDPLIVIAITLGICYLTMAPIIVNNIFNDLLMPTITVLASLIFIPLFMFWPLIGKQFKYFREDSWDSATYSNKIIKLSNTLTTDIKSAQQLKKALSKDKSFIYDSLEKFIVAAQNLKWDIACYAKVIEPFTKTESNGISEILKKRYDEFRNQTTDFRKVIGSLTETAFRYSVWQRSEDHIKIIQTEIELMISSLEEAHAISNVA